MQPADGLVRALSGGCSGRSSYSRGVDDNRRARRGCIKAHRSYSPSHVISPGIRGAATIVRSVTVSVVDKIQASMLTVSANWFDDRANANGCDSPDVGIGIS
jgi:hypothetical protein